MKSIIEMFRKRRGEMMEFGMHVCHSEIHSIQH